MLYVLIYMYVYTCYICICICICKPYTILIHALSSAHTWVWACTISHMSARLPPPFLPQGFLHTTP